MEKIGLNQIRSMFRDFWVSKGCYPGKSASLIPKNDKSLLIINSGMAPLKPYFSGAEKPPAPRMTTCQKCVRTGDIENVGITARHGTFFEMLGNFSFGDYFKEESLTWGWEFITKWLKIPEDRVWATVYQDDDEAVEIWKKIGMPEERIVRLGKEDNFWEIGLGPCGPCSEIYYDRGPEYGCGKPDCKPGCDCDRYMEFWNHVFSQYSKQEDGSYADLAHKNIDTGMGLERMACIMQGVDSIFDIDTIRYILDGVLELCHKPYEAGNRKDDISIRIITDHTRSMVFMISDGILPSNEGRGYVLRRLIRRAYRHGKLLGIEGNFLEQIADRVFEMSGEAYPEIIEKKDYIKKIIRSEEDRFQSTLDQGTDLIDKFCAQMREEGKTVMDGETAFRLYDTYGFPVELTQEILQDYDFTVDMDGFHQNMEAQKELARAGRKDTSGEAWKEEQAPTDLPASKFVGYDQLTAEAEILALYKNGEPAESIEEGETGTVYLDQTPFYAESGGQGSDHGLLTAMGNSAKVTAVRKKGDLYAHSIEVTKGAFVVDDNVTASVDAVSRHNAERNHSATHLLQRALQEVLGDHVQQAGSKNDENFLRFDFTHFEAVTKDQLAQVEALVNEKIDEFLPVTTKEMPLEEAKKLHAMALFNEKYGDTVRVVDMGGWSTELCGGTHVKNTGMIGAFRIVSEGAVSSGVRRIEALTGRGLLNRERQEAETIRLAADALKTNPETLGQKAAQTMEELKAVAKELEEARRSEMGSGIDEMIASAKEINGVKLLTKEFDGASIDELRSLSDEVKEKAIDAVMVFAAVNDGKVVLMVSVTDGAVQKGNHAGKIVKSLAKCVGGGGGGKTDMAQAGGRKPEGVEEAFRMAETLLA